MKKLLYILILFPALVLAQSTDQNYVKSISYKKPTSAGTVDTNNPANAVVQVSYFDGLGRPIQQIAHQQSNSGNDIITHIEYDAFGRQTKEFLPFANTTASQDYMSSASTELATFYNTYNGGTSYPFSEKELESSPLNRVFKQAAPGDAWALGQGKEIKFDYQTNDSADNVKLFSVTATWNASKGLYDIPTAVTATTYANFQLYKTITKDENWTSGKNNTTEEFKDKEGKVVLKRTYNNGDAHDTYYIYDQYGNLTFVLPPLAEGVATQTVLNNLGYQYKYDARNRLVEKKLPGKQWEFIVYDKLDRPVATGPAFSPYGDQTIGWMITQYDVFGRVIQTGWKQMTATSATRTTNQTSINSGTNPFALSANDILTKNYYDNYSFTGAPNPLPTLIENQTRATNVKGLPTGSWVKVLDNATSTLAEVSYTIYDYKYRPVHNKTTNHLGGYTQVDTHLDWAGKTLYTQTKHKRTNADTELVVKDMFEYTDQDRLDVHIQKINALPEQLITKNTYDELGQLISKNVGGTDVTGDTALQTVDYKYNIRGWLKAINDVNSIGNDLFAFKINYDEPMDGTALFNGNISETHWKTASDNILRFYTYQYDHLNRLLEGNYKREGGQFRDSYLERLKYDKNGNIQTLLRHGDSDANDYEFVIDKLQYTYHPENQNQLMKVFDSTNSPQGFKDDSDGINDPSDDYKYDDNANMTKDDNKGIENISYNHLNLPTQIKFVNGSKISYLYNATGQKLKKVVNGSETITTDYLAGFQYHNGRLKHFPHAEGYVTVINGRIKHVFNYTDHLGNIRLSYSDANGDNVIAQDEILEESHYYPFGLKHTAYNTNHMQYIHSEELDHLILAMFPIFAGDGSYNYKFNGVEYQDELGLNMYAMDRRQYDPAIARWVVQDPITHHSMSPYNAFDNNPMYWVDPSGADSYSYDWDSNDGSYINNATGERTKDWKTAISETNKDVGLDSKPLSKKALGLLLGTSDDGEIGDRFDALFKEWGKKNYWTFTVPDDHYESDVYGDVLPDGVSTGMTLLGETGVAPNIAFWDAKATGSNVFGLNFLKDRQLRAYIQVLSKLNVKNTTKNVLIYVTTSDVVNVNAVREYAEKNGVSLRHVVAYSEWGVLGRYLVFKERIWQGVPKGGGIPYTDRNFKSGQEAIKID